MQDKSSSESRRKKRKHCKLKAQNEMVEINANIWRHQRVDGN